MLAVERCHLGVEAVIATPYAAGLQPSSTTRRTWAAPWSTWAAAPQRRHFLQRASGHSDAIAVGGHHVTMDIARGLTTRVSAAERLKLLRLRDLFERG